MHLPTHTPIGPTTTHTIMDNSEEEARRHRRRLREEEAELTELLARSAMNSATVAMMALDEDDEAPVDHRTLP